MPSTFAWHARVDGSDVAGIVLDYAKIDVGRASAFDQPALPVAIVELETPDSGGVIQESWPEFTLGDHAQPSGFTDEFQATYIGVRSRVTLGARVELGASTDSGFTDDFSAGYDAGLDLPRFTGRIQAIAYAPDVVQLTCVSTCEAWGRIDVGGTDALTTIPAESDHDRAQRLCDEGGVTIAFDGPPGPFVIPIPPGTPATSLLEQLTQLASDCGALLYVDRSDQMRYRRRSGIAYTEDVAYDADVPYSYAIGT